MRGYSALTHTRRHTRRVPGVPRRFFIFNRGHDVHVHLSLYHENGWFQSTMVTTSPLNSSGYPGYSPGTPPGTRRCGATPRSLGLFFARGRDGTLCRAHAMAMPSVIVRTRSAVPTQGTQVARRKETVSGSPRVPCFAGPCGDVASPAIVLFHVAGVPVETQLVGSPVSWNPVLLSILTDSLARGSIKHLRANSRCLYKGCPRVERVKRATWRCRRRPRHRSVS